MKKILGEVIGKYLAVAVVLLIILGSVIFCVLHVDSDVEGKKNNLETSDNDIDTEKKEWSIDKLASYIKICDYENLEITIDAPEVISDYDMELYVNHVLKSFPEYELLHKTIVDKVSCVNIDIIGVLENDAEPCLEEKGVYYIPGQTKLLSEIEKALLGKSVGEIIEVNYVYPDNFVDAEYSGKKITFTVKINGIYEQIIRTYDEIDDAFAKNVLKCRSKDEFLSQIKTEMYSILSEYEEDAVSNAVINKAISESSFDVPDSYYEDKFEQDRQLFINYYCSGDETQYEKQIANYSGYTAAEYKKKVFEDFKKLVNFELVAMTIASDIGLTTESEDYVAFIEMQKESYGNTSVDNLHKLLTSKFESGEEYLKKQYYMYAVTNYLCEHVSIERTENATVSGIVFAEE